MVREIINIDEERCTGCGLCIPNCPEGALQIIDGKAQLVGDLFCDGLGACIGHCPEDAITVEKREAEPYDERRVMRNIITKGPNVIRAHLRHLEDHGESELAAVAREVLKEERVEVPEKGEPGPPEHHEGCPGSRFREISREERPATAPGAADPRPSELQQWPVQLHLVPASAPWLRGRDLLLSADCAAYAAGDFHRDFLRGKALAIACPKLDSGIDTYIDKLSSIMEHSGVRSIEVLMMQVPCCGGLLRIVEEAMERSGASVPLGWTILGVDGSVLQREEAGR